MFRKCLAFTLLCILSASAQAASGQKPYLSINAGLSKDMRVETENRWKMGPSFGANIFFASQSKISFGINLSYNHWSVDTQGWEDFLYEGYQLDEVSGTQSIIELVPSMRVKLTGADRPVRLCFQAGVGLFFVNESDVKIRGTINTFYQTGWMESTTEGGSSICPGLQAGPCLLIGKRLELLPIYSLYKMDGDLYNHYSIKLGIRVL